MTENNPLVTLNEAGQSVWLDFIQRSLLENGDLTQLIEEDKIAGLTSNPAIFKQAIAGSEEYDNAIREAVEANSEISDIDIYNDLAVSDIQGAADAFLSVFENGSGADGMVSIEVSPTLADDVEGTIAEAKELHQEVNRANVMIKVPGTKAGVTAFEELTRAGINVNVTLLFSVERYKEIAEAYIRGLEKRVEDGNSIKGITSVASFFISRVDTAVDKALAEKGIEELQGKIAIANAKLAYRFYQELFRSERFAALAEQGALVQRLLWASTGTKNPDYSDVLYIEELIGTETVNTVPPATLDAFRDHGSVAETLTRDVALAEEHISKLQAADIDLSSITYTLERDGLEAFVTAFDDLMASLSSKRKALLD